MCPIDVDSPPFAAPRKYRPLGLRKLHRYTKVYPSTYYLTGLCPLTLMVGQVVIQEGGRGKTPTIRPSPCLVGEQKPGRIVRPPRCRQFFPSARNGRYDRCSMAL